MTTTSETVRRAVRKYRAKMLIEHPEICLWRNVRHRARNRGIEFAISSEDILAAWPPGNICPVLGVFMKGHNTYEPSVDRRDNDVGYTPENIRIISLRANRLKSDATLDESRAVLAYQEGHPLYEARP